MAGISDTIELGNKVSDTKVNPSRRVTTMGLFMSLNKWIVSATY